MDETWEGLTLCTVGFEKKNLQAEDPENTIGLDNTRDGHMRNAIARDEISIQPCCGS